MTRNSRPRLAAVSFSWAKRGNSGDDARAFKHCKNSLYWNNSGWTTPAFVGRTFADDAYDQARPDQGPGLKVIAHLALA
jgi:hypothetical protein